MDRRVFRTGERQDGRDGGWERRTSETGPTNRKKDGSVCGPVGTDSGKRGRPQDGCRVFRWTDHGPESSTVYTRRQWNESCTVRTVRFVQGRISHPMSDVSGHPRTVCCPWSIVIVQSWRTARGTKLETKYYPTRILQVTDSTCLPFYELNLYR